MRIKIPIIVVLVLLLAISVFLTRDLYSTVTKPASPDVYLGIDVAYGDFEAIKELISEVSSYTNLFVVGCTAITHNVTKLDETCQYLYDKILSFIIYQSQPVAYDLERSSTSFNWTRPSNVSILSRPPTSSNWTRPFPSFNLTRPFNTSVSNWTQTGKTRWGKTS